MTREIEYTPISHHLKWLKASSEYYSVPEHAVLGMRRTESACRAKQTFYWLCLRDNINLYDLSEHLGKHRTVIINGIKHPKNRDKKAEDIIWEKLK